MAENQSVKNQDSSDEIDLGQLFQLIGRGFNAIFRFTLRVFLYLKKKAFILIGLVLVGIIIGYGLNKIVSQELKMEIIVKPQLKSKNYLYDVVDEIQSNIDALDTTFFKSIGIKDLDFSGLEITVNRMSDGAVTETDMQYLELLQSFDNTDAIADIVRAELQNKSSFNHRITIYYKNRDSGAQFAEKVIDYINSNEYFDNILLIARSNAKSRIEENQTLLKQVDEIINNYTNNLVSKNNQASSERIILDNQEQVNIAELFQYKNVLIRDIETKKMELVEQTKPISIINFGKTQIVRKSFFGKNLVFVPLLLLMLFFLFSIIKYLNRKSLDLNKSMN